MLQKNILDSSKAPQDCYIVGEREKERDIMYIHIFIEEERGIERDRGEGVREIYIEQ